jgi:hypothetical protein
MRKLIVAAALAGACWLPASMAQAGQYSDALGDCTVAHTTAQDRMVFIVWMFEAMSVHPAVKPLTNISEAQRTAGSKQAADLMVRLMTVDCHTEMAGALKYEGLAAIETAFERFGKVAMEGLISDPGVNKAMEGLSSYMDQSKFDAVAKEASDFKDPGKH